MSTQINELTSQLRSGATASGEVLTTRNDAVSRSTVDLIIFRHLCSVFFSQSPIGPREGNRQAIVSKLRKDEDFDLTTELLRTATAASREDRLQIAIDILSELGEFTLQYAKDYTTNDICNRGFNSAKPWQPNTDFWYILLRAAARCSADINAREEFILRFAEPANRLRFDMLEGIIEALGDLGTPRAFRALKEILINCPLDQAKELAGDVLADLDECPAM